MRKFKDATEIVREFSYQYQEYLELYIDKRLAL